MKLINLSQILLALTAIAAGANLHARNIAQYNTIPLPHEVEAMPGRPFIMGADVKIAAGQGLENEARFMADYLSSGLRDRKSVV